MAMSEKTSPRSGFCRRLFCAPFCCLFPCMRVPPEKVGIRLKVNEDGNYCGEHVTGLTLVDRSKETLHLVDPQHKWHTVNDVETHLDRRTFLLGVSVEWSFDANKLRRCGPVKESEARSALEHCVRCDILHQEAQRDFSAVLLGDRLVAQLSRTNFNGGANGIDDTTIELEEDLKSVVDVLPNSSRRGPLQESDQAAFERICHRNGRGRFPLTDENFRRGVQEVAYKDLEKQREKLKTEIITLEAEKRRLEKEKGPLSRAVEVLESAERTATALKDALDGLAKTSTQEDYERELQPAIDASSNYAESLKLRSDALKAIYDPYVLTRSLKERGIEVHQILVEEFSEVRRQGSGPGLLQLWRA